MTDDSTVWEQSGHYTAEALSKSALPYFSADELLLSHLMAI